MSTVLVEVRSKPVRAVPESLQPRFRRKTSLTLPFYTRARKREKKSLKRLLDMS